MTIIEIYTYIQNAIESGDSNLTNDEKDFINYIYDVISKGEILTREQYLSLIKIWEEIRK